MERRGWIRDQKVQAKRGGEKTAHFYFAAQPHLVQQGPERAEVDRSGRENVIVERNQARQVPEAPELCQLVHFDVNLSDKKVIAVRDLKKLAFYDCSLTRSLDKVKPTKIVDITPSTAYALYSSTSSTTTAVTS